MNPKTPVCASYFQPKTLILGAIAASFGFLLGCSTTPEADPRPNWHEDIHPIIEGRCVGCHKPGGIGGFDLSTIVGAKAAGPAIKAVTAARTMPPWHAGPEQQYRGDPSLTDAQIKAIGDWVDSGMPAGDPANAAKPLEDVTEKLSRTDLEISMPVAYTPKNISDDYRCFLVDFPKDKETYVTGFNVLPDNRGVVHHVAAFLITTEALGGAGAMDTLAALDKKEVGPGYACYGGPSGAAKLIVPIQQLGQWVPGQLGTNFPDGTGIRVPAGSKIVIQMHYNMDFSEPGPDQTKMQFKLGAPDTIKRQGAFAPWLNAGWLGTTMKIPAGNPSVSHAHTADPRGFWKNFVGGVDVASGFVIHGGLLHMHTLGKWAEVYVTRSNGDKVFILRSPKYDFNWQRLYMLEKPVTFHDGDQLTVRCNWDNSSENQSKIAGKAPSAPKDVFWGEGSLQEMCVANLYISEL
ncbi:MAG: monooxygenase [Myxococcales bacterium]|nr:monooxygenase [Myxococcales bacterium]